MLAAADGEADRQRFEPPARGVRRGVDVPRVNVDEDRAQQPDGPRSLARWRPATRPPACQSASRPARGGAGAGRGPAAPGTRTAAAAQRGRPGPHAAGRAAPRGRPGGARGSSSSGGRASRSIRCRRSARQSGGLRSRRALSAGRQACRQSATGSRDGRRRSPPTAGARRGFRRQVAGVLGQLGPDRAAVPAQARVVPDAGDEVGLQLAHGGSGGAAVVPASRSSAAVCSGPLRHNRRCQGVAGVANSSSRPTTWSEYGSGTRGTVLNLGP